MVALIAGSTASAGPADGLTDGLTKGPTDAATTASTVGAGSYTTNPVGPLPGGCGTVSTNPRQFLTARAPTGAIPTNDWWSSLVFKRLNCQYSENLEAHPLSFLPNANGLGFSYSTTAQLLAPAPGLQEYHYPYLQDFTAGVGGLNAPIVKVDGWSDWTVTPGVERRLADHDGDHRATASRSPMSTSPGAARRSRSLPAPGVAECRRFGRVHRQRA